MRDFGTLKPGFFLCVFLLIVLINPEPKKTEVSNRIYIQLLKFAINPDWVVIALYLFNWDISISIGVLLYTPGN